MCSRVLGVDRRRQRFDGGQMKTAQLFRFARLIVDALEVNLVGPESRGDYRYAEQHIDESEPRYCRIDDGGGDPGSEGRPPGPQIAVDPEPTNRTSLFTGVDS